MGDGHRDLTRAAEEEQGTRDGNLIEASGGCMVGSLRDVGNLTKASGGCIARSLGDVGCQLEWKRQLGFGKEGAEEEQGMGDDNLAGAGGGCIARS
ncbi:hypothetical protein ACLOJK_006329 [Asimina triloba]